MIPATFLVDHTLFTAVDLLPDGRLINVVIDDGVLYGVKVTDTPTGVSLTRRRRHPHTVHTIGSVVSLEKIAAGEWVVIESNTTLIN